jgi:hypothetical protein
MIRVWHILAVLTIALSSRTAAPDPGESIRGLNLVAPPRPFQADPMHDVRLVNANYVAVIPYALCQPGNSQVRHNASPWWGERLPGIIKTIDMAKARGLKVMLKPQVYVPQSWPGAIDFEGPADWRLWEMSYREYVLTYARIADSLEVSMFCIGTELRLSATKRPFFWKNLIREVRSFYSGELVYAANWDDYRKILFWSDLDYIGVDAYFPLDSSKTPEVGDLMLSWKPIVEQLESFSDQLEKRVVFTEYGYLSVDHCAGKTWELEQVIFQLDINEIAQANALEALYRTFYDCKFWAGGFLWKWFPNMEGHEGYPGRDYTPQGKLAQEVVKNWFGR